MIILWLLPQLRDTRLSLAHWDVPSSAATCASQWCQVERFLEIVSSAPKKGDNLNCCCLVYLSNLSWLILAISVVSPSTLSQCSYHKEPQHLSRSIHDCFWAQVWYQGDFTPSACQSRWLYRTLASHLLILSYWRLLFTVIRKNDGNC